MSDNGNTFLGVLAGTAIGAALGILFAPDRGSETRRRIAEEAAHGRDVVVDRASEIRNNIGNTLANQKGNLEDQVESIVSNASYKAEDVITTLEAKLKDLKQKNKNLQKKTS
ncbi:YtxH domain-containing protein [Winogradskyella ursingii]|uniref:YtxH domain-containing protein n=1 Tax=Winogradskyella ursingii TaxID=2686079 RepID=UPI0015CA5C13|nr:YtxH domain-containing protein [Winogradskyella ursingii]